MADTASPAANTIDLETLRSRYRTERDKRLRRDGITQYIATEADFAYYADDPYVARSERPARETTHHVLIAGGGFGGILTAVQLAEAGIEDFLIVEKGGGLGGTWYWNRYPGLACDMKSYVYLPLLEETGYMPPRNYASGPEIREHAERIARQWDLHRRALLQTSITGALWDEASGHWIVTTDRGDILRGRYLVTAHGPMAKPKLPGIPGIASFTGHSFHTSRWDYAYTGGSPEGGLIGLAGKRVAIIGTGATAIQCVPALAEHAAQLYVVQRTPSGVDVREEKPTDPAWTASLRPGWHQALMENFNTLTSGGFAEQDLIDDGWTFLFKSMRAGAGVGGLEELLRAAEIADAQKMEEIRGRIDAIVKDPKTAAALKPWYRRFCKRPVFHDGYLETFNRPNVTLVDTDGAGVDEILPGGFRVGAHSYDVDCLIFASGFEVGTDYSRRAGYQITGRQGQSLRDKWSRGLATLHGMHVHGFPNLFIHQNAQGALPANFCHGLLEAAKTIACIISHANAQGMPVVEARAEAEAGWVQHCRDVASIQLGFFENCTPGYYNLEGHLTAEAAQGFGYGLGPAMFFQLIDAWRKDGTFSGLAFTTA